MLGYLRWAMALCAFGLLTACSSVFGPVEQPSVSITSLRLLPAEGAAQRVEVGLRIMNPNDFPLQAKGLVLEAGFNDIPLLRGASAELPEVPAYGEAQVTVTLSASLVNGLRLVRSIMEHPDDPLYYRLEARIDLKKPILQTLRIQEQGEIAARPPLPAAGEPAP